MEIAVPDEVVSRPFPFVFHPPGHAVVLLLEDPGIAVAPVHLPGDDHGRVRPPRRSRRLSALRIGGQHVGDDVGDGAVFVLIGLDVAEPLGEEPGHVHVQGGGGGEDLGIPGPAHALVALGAVGGDVEEIPLLAPDDVAQELVDQRLRRHDLTRGRHGGMDDDAGQAVRGERPRVAVDHDVPEPEEREMRLERLVAAAFQRVADGRLGLAQVREVDVPFLVEDFGMPQRSPSCPPALPPPAAPSPPCSGPCRPRCRRRAS